MHHFLARALFGVLRSGVQQVQALFEEAPALAQVGRRFRLENELNFLRQVLNAVEFESHRHPPARSHRVDRDRKLRWSPVDCRFLEDQCLAASGRFHLAVRPLADDEICLDRDRDAGQLTGAIERFDELPERAVRHRAKMAFLGRNNKPAPARRLVPR